MKNCEKQLSLRMRNDNGLQKIRMKRSNIEELNEKIMKRSQIVKSTKEQGLQKKIHLEWKANSIA